MSCTQLQAKVLNTFRLCCGYEGYGEVRILHFHLVRIITEWMRSRPYDTKWKAPAFNFTFLHQVLYTADLLSLSSSAYSLSLLHPTHLCMVEIRNQDALVSLKDSWSMQLSEED